MRNGEERGRERLRWTLPKDAGAISFLLFAGRLIAFRFHLSKIARARARAERRSFNSPDAV